MYPIYALWAHPRSMSTAIERLMRARGDLDCLHEPFLHDYYLNRRQGPDLPHFRPDPAAPQTYKQIRDDILARADAGPVFFKDMAYYVMPHILEDAGFLARLTPVFLIRDPHATIASYYRLDPQVSSEEIGLVSLHRLFQAVARRDGAAPPVLRAEAVQQDPQGLIGALWARLGLAPAAGAFNWRDAAVPEDWNYVAGWHDAVSASAGIRPPEPDRAERDRARFARLCLAAPHLNRYLESHMPAYRALAEHVLRP